MKLVAALRVKNESWVIKYTLSALSEFVDGIVVLDDGSTDTTLEIVRGFKKVIEVKENGALRSENDVDEAKDWNILTRMALKHGADWILYTDADEMLEPKFVENLDAYLSDPQVGMYRFRKVSPWKSLEYYRKDSQRFDNVAANTLNPILVRATRGVKWDDGRGGLLRKIAKRILRGERFKPSLGRGFPEGIDGKVKNIDELVSVHFNHLDMDRLLRKQVFYALVEKRMRPNRKRDEIVHWVANGWSEEGMRLEKLPSEWLWNEFVQYIEYAGEKDHL